MILKIGKSHLYCRAIEREQYFKTVEKAIFLATLSKLKRSKTGTLKTYFKHDSRFQSVSEFLDTYLEYDLNYKQILGK